MDVTPLVGFSDVAAAHERIRGHVHRTPVLRSATVDAPERVRTRWAPAMRQAASSKKGASSGAVSSPSPA